MCLIRCLLLRLKKNATKSVFYLRIISLMCAHMMHEEIWRKKSSTITPLDPTLPPLNFFSPVGIWTILKIHFSFVIDLHVCSLVT